jgi:hypothetical protein
MSSPKLQPCLELCRFIQALLKTKLARWKSHFLSGISKRPLCIIHRNRWRITQGTQPERRVLCLESHCYNKSHPDPKLTASLRLMIECLSLFISNPCLTFLSSACILFTSQPSVLLGSHLLCSHIIVISQGTHVTSFSLWVLWCHRFDQVPYRVSVHFELCHFDLAHDFKNHSVLFI